MIKKYYQLFLSFVFLLFSQVYYFLFVFESGREYMFFAPYFFSAAFFLLAFYRLKTSFLYLFPVVLLYIGWIISYKQVQSVTAFIFYGLSAAAFTAVKMYLLWNKPQPAPGDLYEEGYRPGRSLIVVFGMLAVLAFSMSDFMTGFFYNLFPRSGEMLVFLPLREQNGCSSDICSGPFRNFAALIFPVLYAAAAFAFLYAIRNGKIKTELLILAGLVVMAIAGKYAVMSLSGDGIGLLARKISAPIDNSYYHFAVQIKDLGDFVKNYVASYQLGGIGVQTAHLKGHPALATIFYWILIKVFSPAPFVIGAVYTALTALVIIPIYVIVKEITSDSKAALYGSFLYMLTPFSLIMSSAGIDSTVLLFTASSLALYMKAASKNSGVYALAGGVFFGINAYLTFGLWPLLVALPMLYFIKNTVKKKTVAGFIRIFIFFLAGVMFFHLFFQVLSGFKYDYMASFNAAKTMVFDISGRPYIIWWWGNMLHWAIFFSVPTSALLLYRLGMAAIGKIKMDWYSMAAFTVMAMFFLGCMGRAEQHRQWLFLAVFAIPPAILAIGSMDKNGTFRVNELYFTVFSAAVFINTVLLEIFVTDAI